VKAGRCTSRTGFDPGTTTMVDADAGKDTGPTAAGAAAVATGLELSSASDTLASRGEKDGEARVPAAAAAAAAAAEESSGAEASPDDNDEEEEEEEEEDAPPIAATPIEAASSSSCDELSGRRRVSCAQPLGRRDCWRFLDMRRFALREGLESGLPGAPGVVPSASLVASSSALADEDAASAAPVADARMAASMDAAAAAAGVLPEASTSSR
jgi:hypothetical protein